jgi:hypothetical protein
VNIHTGKKKLQYGYRVGYVTATVLLVSISLYNVLLTAVAVEYSLSLFLTKLVEMKFFPTIVPHVGYRRLCSLFSIDSLNYLYDHQGVL